MQDMFDWDDLRVFLAAARAGSLGVAGQRLGLDTTTVGRRVARLESALKSTLFVRSPQGLQLTASGAQLAEIAVHAETAIEAAEQVTRTDVVAGTVRISAAEGFGSSVLAPALPSLLAARPGLRVELAANAGFLSASRREVDMAITLSPPDAQRLVVEPLTRYELGLYAAPSYLAGVGTPREVSDLRDLQIVGYVNDLIYAPELRYLEEIWPDLRPTLASSSIQAQRAIIAGGGGVGVLPCFLAGPLTRLLPAKIRLERRFWLSTHKDVHGTARLRAVRGWLRDLVRTEVERLAPGSPAGP
jgi:DNA-binding transcriptional LysR family regulator